MPIFLDEIDYIRFLFFTLVYQAPLTFYNISRQASYFAKHSHFTISQTTLDQIVVQRNVELNAFAIMPNHFHLSVQEKTQEGKGISSYLQRIQTGYAKYFNTKYAKKGHLFQGSFRAVPIETNEQLLYLSAYIHRNPRDLAGWRGKEAKYPWSSYQDFITKNRWGKLLKPGIILNQFPDISSSYNGFVETSTAKLQPGESPIKHLFLE
ncbi:MAG: transposase [bacterium]|nr:transposase [bacterium]